MFALILVTVNYNYLHISNFKKDFRNVTAFKINSCNCDFLTLRFMIFTVRKTCPYKTVKKYFEISCFVELSGYFLAKGFVFS